MKHQGSGGVCAHTSSPDSSAGPGLRAPTGMNDGRYTRRYLSEIHIPTSVSVYLGIPHGSSGPMAQQLTSLGSVFHYHSPLRNKLPLPTYLPR